MDGEGNGATTGTHTMWRRSGRTTNKHVIPRRIELDDRRPDTRAAVLYSDGAHRFTWHTYARSELVGTSLDHFFRCDETGVERQWGREAA